MRELVGQLTFGSDGELKGQLKFDITSISPAQVTLDKWVTKDKNIRPKQVLKCVHNRVIEEPIFQVNGEVRRIIRRCLYCGKNTRVDKLR